MFQLIFKIKILIYIIFMIYSILDIQKYNENGLIADCSSIEDIQDNLKIQEKLYDSIIK